MMGDCFVASFFLVYNTCSGLPVQILWIDRVVVLLITGLSHSDLKTINLS